MPNRLMWSLPKRPDSTRTMEVSVIDTYSEFRHLRQDWNDLLKRSCFPHPQLTWEWCDIAWRHQKMPCHLAVLCVADDGRLVGIAPLMVVSEPIFLKGLARIRRLTLIPYGTSYADTADLIVDKKNATKTVESIWEAVYCYPVWDSLRFERLTSMSPNFNIHHQVCRGLFPGASWTVRSGHAVIPVRGSFEEYWRTLRRSKAIRDVERRLRRLEERGGRLRVQVTTVWDEEVTQRLLRLDHKHMEATGRRSFLLRSDADWLAELRETYTKLGYWLVFLAFDEGNDESSPIAYCVCLGYEGGVYVLETAYDPEYARYSIMKLLFRHMLAESWKRNARLFDFMSGAEEYKLQWRPEVALTFDLAFHRNRVKEEIELLWLQMMRTSRGTVSRIRRKVRREQRPNQLEHHATVESRRTPGTGGA